MSYSDAVYSKAYAILNERRNRAIALCDNKKAEIFSRLPRAEEIERELSSCSINAARAVFSGGDTKAQLEALSNTSKTLKSELEALLASKGYTLNDLEPQFTCKVCEDRGQVEKDNKTLTCNCLKELLKECACNEVNSLSPLSLSTFESFDLSYYPETDTADGVNPRRRMTQIFNYCKNYAKTFTLASKSILMRGSTGLGKTHLSLSIANELLSKGFSVVYVSAPDILFQLERAHFSYNYDKEQELLDTLSNCDLLIIDDLGTEFATNYTNAQIYNIFNNRILLRKPVIINTNLTMKDLETSYTPRFVSRVMGTCDKLDFVGRDIRPQKN